MTYAIYCPTCLEEHCPGLTQTGFPHLCEKHGGSEINDNLYRKYFPNLFKEDESNG